MNNFRLTLPAAYNEPIKSYLPKSPERKLLEAEIERQLGQVVDIPLVINGNKIRTSTKKKIVPPHDHQHLLATYSNAEDEHIHLAIESALDVKNDWESMPWQDRASIFLKAADLISRKYTYLLNAATMLGQSKTAYQAEIDATCELVDFFRFNVKFMEEIYARQPFSEKGTWNRIEYRPLEGFVFALTPFNFTAIAANLCAAPAIMGNTIVWKPSSTAILSGYYLMRILKEAGLPDGVINFIPGKGPRVGDIVLNHKDLAGIHFTGSTKVFQSVWKKVGENIAGYKSYPRIVGETGGKDYIFVHPTADIDQVAAAAIRGAFEYQGQKCSAASRMYVPKSRWNELKDKLVLLTRGISIGNVTEFKHFMNAVIDEGAFDTAVGYIERAKTSKDAELLVGGGADKTKGYFVEPTIILAKRQDYETMTEEIFGPVLTVFVYENQMLNQTLDIVDKTSIYALTGAVFATDRNAINRMMKKLVHSAGNFYINDKPTGAVVGQQPFGGSRGSGTNDKAGSMLNLLRWTSARTIKENFVPPQDYRYPFMKD
ncbi:MAG: L-glutamate gamma-semialdehyde dehydrogenase [Desulfobacula sp.]|nr:L-glutamate gamma-semialdehyde dehydrogenase [Desulfobacula sp.]